MGILRFRVAGKENIEFGNAFVEFIRGGTATKSVGVTYTNGTGQYLALDEILYTYLTPGVDGYIEVKSANNQTLSGSGVLNLLMTHKVSNTQVNQNISFNYDSSTILIQVSYNSKPIAEDITKDIGNRAVYTFDPTDFTDHYNDFDNDALSQVSIYGNVTGYAINGNPYIEGDWISLSTIDAGLLTYTALSQDAYYENDSTWKAKDVNGNISE